MTDPAPYDLSGSAGGRADVAVPASGSTGQVVLSVPAGTTAVIYGTWIVSA